MIRVRTNRPKFISERTDDQEEIVVRTDASSVVLAQLLQDLAGLTLTDGQMLRYDGTTGHLAATNPVGTSLNASASNTTGVVTTASGPAQPALGFGTIVLIPGTAISVTNSNGRNVKLEFEATFQQSVAGTGSVWLALAETTSGTSYKKYNIKVLPGVTTANLNQVTFGLDSVDIGVVTTTRTFALHIVVASATTTATPQIQVFNQATHPSINRAVNL